MVCEETHLKTIVGMMKRNDMKYYWRCLKLLFFHVSAVDGKVIFLKPVQWFSIGVQKHDGDVGLLLFGFGFFLAIPVFISEESCLEPEVNFSLNVFFTMVAREVFNEKYILEYFSWVTCLLLQVIAYGFRRTQV